MRDEFCQALVKQGDSQKFTFFTGDLGFRALEPLEEKLGDRFINAGVAEQNMVGVAAGAASSGGQTFAYSIGPFVYARAFEQIRNDVCFHNVAVCIVGNGGGFGYGVMGPTHHAIEDYGLMRTLVNMKVFIPAFDSDISEVIAKIFERKAPSYLRLGRGELPKNVSLPDYAPIRKFEFISDEKSIDKILVIVCGAIAGTVIKLAREHADQMSASIQVIVISELESSVTNIVDSVELDIKECQKLVLIEEHVLIGGLNQSIGYEIAVRGISPKKIESLYAKNQLMETYGDQKFCRGQNGLDDKSLSKSFSLAVT